jgi:hypothetical protein
MSMWLTVRRLVAATLCIVAGVPDSAPAAVARSPWHLSRYEAISAVRSGPDDVILVASGPCGRRPQHSCTAVFRSSDGGRSWSRIRHSPERLAGSTLTGVGPHAAWLSQPIYGRRAARTYLTTDDGRDWRRLKLTNIESVVTVGATVYAAKAHSLFVGTGASRSMRWIGPSGGGQLSVAGSTVYNYPAAHDRLRHWGPRLIAITGETIRAAAQPCPRAFGRVLAIAGDADGSVLAMCAGEPGMGQQLKRSFVSWDGATTWHRTGTPSSSGYTGSEAAGGAGATFVATGRAPLQITHDDGRTWRFLHVPPREVADGEWRVGFDASGVYGWAVEGTYGSPLYLSDDGGRTWRRAAVAKFAPPR